MNGHLVVIRHEMEDVPLGLFATHTAAVEFSKTVTPDSGNEEMQIIRTDASTPFSVGIYSFENSKLVKADIVRCFDDEEIEA